MIVIPIGIVAYQKNQKVKLKGSKAMKSTKPRRRTNTGSRKSKPSPCDICPHPCGLAGPGQDLALLPDVRLCGEGP